jgi:hypothetical protein
MGEPPDDTPSATARMFATARTVATAFRPSIVRRALVMSAIVGTLLMLINHADAILRGTMTSDRWYSVLFTYFVPYIVSTISSVQAMRDR